MNPASIEDRTDISYHYNKISVPIPNPTKKADKEGKTLIAGDESTQYISQYTGVNQKLDKFAVGDAIQYTNDGRLPVSFDLSKWTVTTSNGTNVTAQGKFTQYDKTFEGKKYHVVSWSPTNVSSLKDNEAYTLNTILKTLNDGITDGEIDRAVGGGDGVTFGEAHGYDEFNPTTDKAWKEGSQTVNGKIEINEDIAHAKVTMTMPDPAKLANKLSNVAITDNYSKFANLVTVTGANVYENERNATSDYTIVNNNKVVTATRKNPATANGGTVSLVVDFKVNPDVPSGTKLVNSGSGTINTQTVPTPDAQIVTFTQKPTKHWIEGSQVVDGKTYINNDIVTTQVDMNLPDPKQLAKTLSYVSIGDNYRDFADKTVLQSYKVFENGTDVTSQYTITNQDGILQAVRKNAATTPGGKVSLIATFAINHDVKSGTKLTNRGFGRINNHTVDTNTPQIVTFKQDTSKHWVEGSQVVDDKTYINEDMVHGQVTMTLPNKDSLAKALTDVALVDDYSDYANKVSYVNAQVFENNTDVTSQYNITNAGNKITATRKNPGATPSGSVRLVANFKLNSNLPSGTKLINRGSGRINNNTVNTNEAKILTYVQSTDKHWVEGSQKVDGKTYIDGDTIHGQVTMTLPDKNTLAKALSTVQIIDDYSKFAKMVDYKSAQVLENGKDVTSEYNISNAYGQVVATRKNATATPSGNVTLNVTWTIHKDVPSGTQLVNSGSGRINSHTVPTPNRNIVTYKQDTLKNWLNSHGQIVNDKTVIDRDIVHGQVEMTLPDPNKLANKLSKVEVVDDYSNFADKVIYIAAQVLENREDVTAQYNIVNANGKVTATRKDPITTPSGKVVLLAKFQVHSDVKSGTELVNKGYGTLNTETIETNTPKIITFRQDTDKHWVEGSQVVDGKTYIANDVVNGQVTMTLPDPTKLAEKLKYVSVTDDYSKFASLVDYQSAQVLENGKDVTSLYTIANTNGHVTVIRKDPTTTPAGKVTLNVHWRIHKDVKSGTQLVNSGNGSINEETVPTPNRNIVTFKQDGLKDWLNSQNQVVNGKTYIDNDMVHAKLAMNLPDPKALATPLTKVQLDDNYSSFAKLVDYVSSQVLENGTDVTSQYNIVNNNGHVITTRKDASKIPGGKVEFKVNFKIHTDVPSGTTLMNSGEVTLNTETIPTPTPNIVTYKPDTDKHWVEGTQVVDGKTYIDNDFVHGQVTMTLPDPTKLAEKLKHVSVTDDYSRFAKMVDYKSAQVLENGKDVTAQYNITNANGKVVATRKDASTTPNGSVTLNVTWRIHTDVKSGTVFVNGGDGRINDETVPTPDRNIVTYKQDGFKDWINSQNQVVNDKTYIDNDVVHAKLVTTLPNPKALATPLTKVQLDDDYTSYAKMVNYVGARVLENGTDVTNQYNIVNANGHVKATRKDPSKAPNGNAELRVDFRIHTDVPSGTKLFNSGSVTLNTETIPTPTPSVETYRQDTDKHWVEGSQVVDGKTYIDGDNVSAQVSMTLPEPSKLAEKLKRVVVTDDFSKFADKVDYKSAKVLENGKDVTAQYDIKVANGKVIATRKDASTTPAGKVVLQAFWKVHNDIESNTQLVNSGSGQINDEVVPTPDRTTVTYKQDTEKHWRDDGGQIVDGKIAINDDVVTARVDMTLPKEENLAKPLDKIQLVDDFSKFADKVTLQAVHVYENGKDVTDQYDIHVENGRVVATRKDASKVYDHTGAANATMKATLNANKDLNVNDLVHTASANINDSKVSTVNKLAFNRLFAKSFIVSNLAVTSDNNIKSQIDMAVPINVDAKTPMTVTSDYSNFAKYVNVKDATVYENGKNVTADYTIKDDKAGHVTATKKAGSESDGGQVSLVVDYEVNHGIPNGTILENHGSGTLNGQDVPTNTPSITIYTQDTNKHWVEGDQNVDGKIYVNGSTAHAQVSMTLPDQSKLINKLSNVSIDDDYSKFAKLVDYKSAKVLENGKDVTSEYTIKNANGHVTAVRKDASKTPAGNVQLLVDFEIHKDVKSGTELINGGSGTLNKNTVPTNTPSIWTYTPDGEKHWVLDNNVTDNKIYFSGDKAVAQVSVDLPDASKLATPLNKLVLVDNYSDFADKVKLDSAKVLENGKDVTSEYDLTNKDGKVVATRKDAAKTPSGKAVLVTTFTINNGIENATALHNKGSVTVDSITDEVPDTPIVVFTPKAHKDVELGGDVKGDTENSVDGSLILNGSVVTYPITTSDLPAERAEDITKRVVKDTLDKNAEFVGFKAWIENDKGELEDVTSHYKLDKNGQDLTFTEDSYLLGLYNKDKSKQTHTPIIDLVVKAKGDAQKITNKATVLTNDNVTETNEVSVDTPAKPTPTKVDKNEKGVNIDGKNVLPGSVNNYELTMDLAKFKGIKVTDQDLAKGFYFVDDYPEEALDVDPQTFTYKTVDGKTVKGLSAKVYQSLSEVPENVATALKANGITPSGAFVLISADDPAQFFKDYVETGTTIIVNAPMKVKEGFAGKYQNKAWQLTFGQGEATDIVSNNVPKIDPKKDIVISADNRTSLNNHTIELGQNFDYLLKGGILDKDQGHDIYEYKWVDDYDENHDQYNGQFIAPLTVDVTLKDGTVLKVGTDISNHVSQNIDTKTGSVEFSVDKDFLDKVDFDRSGFAADILMSVKRIKAGEVDNTYTNIINSQKFGSNTVHSTTPEPKEPETPATPKTPETPSVPVAQTQTPATPQPVKMVTSTPAPKAPESPALPQTGEANDTLAEEVVGFAAIVAALGMAGTSLKKRED
nr:SspB-related isopeptide-forming adhesin [Ligilactobacillus salivarius]